MKQLNRAKLNVRPNGTAIFHAEVLRLVRAVEDLFASELPIGSSSYRQDSMLRVIVKDATSRVRATLNAKGGDQ
jgi:hypothetical protein